MHAIHRTDGTEILANTFQREVWQCATTNDWTSISAPTSAGKSFILNHWLVDYFQQRDDAHVVYLVPTRALIHQVELDLRRMLADADLDIPVSTLPVLEEVPGDSPRLFVFTQERLHILLGKLASTPRIDVLIVDESHKVGDGTRGVLLQQAIERIVDQSPECKVVFSSPLAENPDTLLLDAPADTASRAIRASEITVNQNLIWATQKRGDPMTWELSLCLPDERTDLGSVEISQSPTPESKRLPFVAEAVGRHSAGNLIYVNGAAAAEKAAWQLFDLVDDDIGQEHRGELDELIELVQHSIHRRYALATVLKKGIGFHYGNMPLLVRSEIERLFREGAIRFLCCTSTLVEGVNLACRNIFVRGPKKGNMNPMKAEDFWNLAGRAGRWGTDFQGNIVCVDARRRSLWNGDEAPTTRSWFRIDRTTDSVLRSADDLFAYLDEGVPAGRVANPVEYVISYLSSMYIRHGSIAESTWSRRFDQRTIAELDRRIGELLSRVDVALDTVVANPGISPGGMKQLLGYFRDRESAVEELLPVRPASDDAVGQYTAVFTRIDQHLAPVFGAMARRVSLAIIVVNWMRGYSLARIISERISYLRRNRREYDLPTEIRTTMKNVEQVARFTAPKYLTCYTDVLRQHLIENNRDDLVEELLDVQVLLEFGVAEKTPLSLLGLGLSRTSALAVYEFIADDSLTEDECLQWIREADLETLPVPELVKREIRNVMQVH
ncbi:MAG: DEAD/DEAH box helicase [Planctomycetes bacterium]|nr:DEAD/DEAH box helicase [Planctomycetota bacterium]